MRTRLLVAVATSALLLAGCGVGTQAAPQLTPRKEVPFGLLDPASTTTSLPMPTTNVTVYFDAQDRLVTVNRVVPAPATVRGALAALAQGPVTAEARLGLQSPVSTVAPVTLESVVGRTATVDLPRSFGDLAGQDQILAVAQVVFTVTAFPGIDGVRIRLGGQRVEVPTDGGTLSFGPLTRAEYASLAPL